MNRKNIIGFAAICLLPVFTNAQQNLISNGDFKTNLSGWKALEGAKITPAKGGHTADKDKADKCLGVKSEEGYGFDYLSKIPVKAGKTYILTYWFKLDKKVTATEAGNDSDGGYTQASTINTTVKFSDTNIDNSKQQILKGDETQWQKVTQEFKVPDGLNELSLEFSVPALVDEGSDDTDPAPINIYFDDFSLVEKNDSTLGLSGVNPSTTLFAYPNPTQDIFYIANPKDTSHQVEIYNTTGDLVKTQTFSNEGKISVSLQNLPKGVYIYKVGKSSGKIIKN